MQKHPLLPLLFLGGLICLLPVKPSQAQNFNGGFNFTLPPGDAARSPFLPSFPARALAEADRVSVQGDKFMANGRPIYFWGVNLTAAGAFPGEANAPRIAANLRKMGVNLVRFHHIDNNWSPSPYSLFPPGQSTRILHPAALDRMERLVGELKKQGIYLNMNLNVSRTFNARDGVAGADSLKDFAKGVTIFDPQMVALQKEYARQLLTRVNPYTGMRLAEDPALAVVEMINENSLYGMWKDGQLRPAWQGGHLLGRHVQRLDSLWNAFLLTKYQTQARLTTAWQPNPRPAPNLVQGGGFEGTTLDANWQNETHNGAQATFGLDTEQPASGSRSARIAINRAGTEAWHVQFKYVNFGVQKDSNYVIQFRARASRNRVIGVASTRDNEPYTWYGGQDFALTTSWQTFRFSVQATEENANRTRLTFQVGQGDGTVWIDDVTMSLPNPQGIQPGELLTNRNVRRADYGERLFLVSQRNADLAEFYLGLQQNFMEDMRNFLRNDLGVRALITGTNALVGIQEGLIHENMDFYDDHSYWDHPNFPGTPWDMGNWNISNASMLKSSNWTAITNAFSGIYLANKPLTISEYNHGFPNRYRSEMVPAIAAYGAFHGMDGLMFFEHNGGEDDTWAQDRVSNYFSLHRDNAVMAQFPACAFAFRQGLIAEGTPTLVNYNRRDIYRSPERDTQGRWGKYVPYDLMLQLSHSVRVGSYQHASGFDPASLPARQTGTFRTNTGQTTLNNQTGVLTTVAPRFVAVAGFLNDAPNTPAGPLTMLEASNFGTLTWLALGSRDLAQADTTLLTLSTRTQNTGMGWTAANNSVNNNWGNAPTSQEPVRVRLRVQLEAEKLILHSLDPSGQSRSSREICPSIPGQFEITLSDPTLWYGLVASPVKCLTTALGPNAPAGGLQVYPNPAQGQLRVEWASRPASLTELGLFTAHGAEVRRQRLAPGQATAEIDLGGLSAGVYLLRAGAEVRKVVVQ
jgi:hypothetical protein